MLRVTNKTERLICKVMLAVSGVGVFAGAVIVSVGDKDVGALIFFLSFALAATFGYLSTRDEISTPQVNQDPVARTEASDTASNAEFIGCLFNFVGVVFAIGIALGLLWGFIALIKFFWTHS